MLKQPENRTLLPHSLAQYKQVRASKALLL